MNSRKLFLSILVVLTLVLFANTPPAFPDSNHIRIIRLSLVQGDVRVARETHGDPLSDSNATWETAEPNLPIRQGHVLATDKGRAEVEFENGAMAFLNENTVLEFYDLSRKDESLTTRLVLRQGSASFYVNPAGDDYFSVTGGDFTVEANGRTAFRLDNYDDGSTVEALKGHVSVLHKDHTTRLDKGQSLSMKAGDDSSLNIARLPEEDDFDHWVSGRIDSVSTATNAALQYTSSPYYAPGFADLYTYGAFSSCGAYGLGWRPFGAGIGWSPFSNGQWVMDPSFGWTWVSYQPWGWAPYHYGGWLFDASCGGWFYSPPLYFGNPGFPVGPGRRFPPRVHPPHPIYRPVTAVFVRQGGKTGVVPMHPLDEKGKTPLNLEHGVYSSVGTRGAGEHLTPVEAGQKWQALKTPPREAVSGGLVASKPPARVSRTAIEGRSGARVISLDKDSSIAYDPKDHRFVNTNSPSTSNAVSGKETHVENGNPSSAASASMTTLPERTSVPPSSTRSSTSAPPPRNTVPPPAPRYSGGDRGGSSSGSGRGGSQYGGSSPSSSGSGRTSSSPSTSSPHPSGGGRPH